MAGWDSVKTIFIERYGVPHYQQKNRHSKRYPFEELYWSSDWIEVGLRGGAYAGVRLEGST